MVVRQGVYDMKYHMDYSISGVYMKWNIRGVSMWKV